MANQGNQQPQFPQKEQLPQQIRQLVSTLEDLLAVRYPIMTNKIPIQARRNPILADIAKVLIAYHVHTNSRAIAEDTTIYRWLRLTPADILTKEAALQKMHQPEDALCELPNAALPFPEPTDMTALHYNARGANLFSFKANLQNIIQQYQPMIVIVTETRLGSGEANQMASRINYRQVLTIDPIGSEKLLISYWSDLEKNFIYA
ncbi:hypothetical protein COLO4_29961 [Corchorus olitorius]|uniref:Uncharacterized protein n=1 Tax=Corchorus olitorius TaxID=93759 RepID=A0A1R3HC81_9ROSI|nr:hypothetical protein COLO4_29961 [Corchorus olitorius]